MSLYSKPCLTVQVRYVCVMSLWTHNHFSRLVFMMFVLQTRMKGYVLTSTSTCKLVVDWVATPENGGQMLRNVVRVNVLVKIEEPAVDTK